MAVIRTVVLAVVLLTTILLGALFALQNPLLVALDLLVVQLPERTLGLWLLLALTAGVVVGLLASTSVVLAQRARLASVRRQRERLAREVDRLRKAGLTESE